MQIKVRLVYIPLRVTQIVTDELRGADFVVTQTVVLLNAKEVLELA